MRPPIPRTFAFFMMCLLDHIPGVVSIVAMPLHFLPYDHDRLALDETPILDLTNHVSNHIDKHFFSFSSFLLYSTFPIYIYRGWFNTP